MDTATKEPSKPVTTKKTPLSYFRLRGRVSTEPQLVTGEFPPGKSGKPTPFWQYNFDVSTGPTTVAVNQTHFKGPQELLQVEFGEWIVVDILSAKTVGEKGVYKTEVKGNIFRD